MSNDALGWAWKAKVGAAKLVLVALADHGTDHSGEDWVCFPSVDRLAERTELGRSTIERHLRTLDAEGWISRRRRVRKDGKLGIFDYTLHREPEVRARLKAERAAGVSGGVSGGDPGLDLGPEKADQPPLKMSGGEGAGPALNLEAATAQNEAQPPLILSAQGTITELSDEPEERAREPGSEGLDGVSAVWPLKGRKFTKWPEARARWAMACERVGEGPLTAAMRRAAADPDLTKGGFCPSLDQWLGDERYRAYLPAAKGSAGCAAEAAARTEFAGPAELRAAIVRDAALGEGFAVAFLDACGWDGAARTLTPRGPTAADRLRSAAIHFRAHAIRVAAPVQVSVGAIGGTS